MSSSKSSLNNITKSKGGSIKKKKGKRMNLKNIKLKPTLNGGNSSNSSDSKEEGRRFFESIIAPVSTKEFFEVYWEKKPLLIKRKNPDFYKSWFSCKELENIIKNNDLEFTTNIDVTTYVNGEKKKHNPDGKVYAPAVWDFFQQGCSIRMLNPHTYSKILWNYLSMLQEFFLTGVGANVYLTPASSQGFAPHYDDIEAFALQLEGKKHWRVYSPRNENESYPIFSSQNFPQDEIGDPIIDCVLEEGDLLYFPRGFIHQANASDEIHSLHITVSCFQKTTYGDFLAKAFQAGIEIALNEDKEFRKNLPMDYLNLGGIAFTEAELNNKKRNLFIQKIIKLSQKVIEDYLPIDAALDQFGKKYLEDSLPPFIKESEMKRSIHGSGEKWNPIKNEVESISELEPLTNIRLIKRNCIRLVEEENGLRLYYNIENSRIYHEKELKYLEVENDTISSIQLLINSYPKYVQIQTLPMNEIDEQISVASFLYEKGLLVTKDKLEYAFEEEPSDDD